MRFVRTVLGDINADRTGICYSHEHVAMRGEHILQRFPEFDLNDTERVVAEISELRELGVGTMIDAMPTDSGRSTKDLIEISSRTGMNILAATGLHLRLYYPERHWYDTIDEADLASLLIREISDGITDFGIQLGAKAGVIKVAGSRDRLLDLERRNFRAAGFAQVATGCPILTHTDQGTAALEQIELLLQAGAEPAHIVLSHLDRSFDLAYLRDVLQSGVKLEFDSSFRWKGEPNHTLGLLVQLAPEFPSSFVLGMDAAKRAYWGSFGGSPGLSFLIRSFKPMLLDEGLTLELVTRMFIDNPREAYRFAVAK